MPVINNFGDVATQGNTQVVGNVTIQGTGTSSWSSATSAVTLAGTLAVTGTTTTTGVILPLNDGVSGIGGPARRYNNVFTANANIYSTANIASANVSNLNVFSLATFVGPITVQDTTRLIGATTVTGTIAPTASGVSGLGGPSAYFANAFLQVANVGTTAPVLSLNVVGNVFVSNTINVTNLLGVSTNMSFMNVLSFMNIATINVFTGANVTTLTVSGLSNLFNANIVSSNLQTTNIQYANVATINVTNAANITTLTVSGLSNLFNANIVSSNLQTTNIQYANVATINVTNAANITTLTVSGLSNLFRANIVSSNLQTMNIQYANVATINVWNGANVTTLTVSGLSNLFNANIMSSNLQTTNIQYANVATINVTNAANITTLTVSGLSNLFNANIVSSNLQTTNIQYANVATINVTNAANITTLTVSGFSNLFNANIVSSNLQTTNIQYANVATINVWNGANVTTLTVSSFANVNLANIVGLVNSTLNVSTQANLQYANMISANVVGTMNVNGLLSARFLTGNGSALMNLHASNISNGVLNFNATNGLGANGIAITGSYGGNGQILASTGGVGAGVQWIGPATGIWSNVAPSINPPPYPIYYGIGNVGIGNTLWTSFGTGFNTYPGTPLDVYGGFGTFSNVSDAPFYGTIRIQNNPGTHAAPGGLEFKCGTSGVPGPGGGTGHRLVASELTLGTGVAPLIWQVRSGTWNWSNVLAVMCGSAYSGYVGIGTMSPLYQMHVYQNSNTSVASITAQFSNANQSAYLYLSNTSGTSTTLYLNGPNNSSDGIANSATLRNDAGDLRLAARLTQPYIYLQTSTSNVGINTTIARQALDVAGYARIGSGGSDIARLILGRAPGTTNFDYASMIESVSTLASNYQSTLRFYTHGTATTGADPTLAMTIDPTQRVGIGIAPSYKFHVDNGANSGINAVVQASTITAGNTTSIILGKALSTNNSGTFLWNHVGDGLATNYLGLGYWGGDNKLCVAASGNVGIGTTNPLQVLHIYSGTSGNPTAGAGTGSDPNASFRLQMVTISLDIGVYSGGTTWIQNRQPGTSLGTTFPITFQPIGGNVGIGAPSPGDLLHVLGTSNPSIRIDAGAGGTSDPRLHFYSGTTFRGRVAYSYGGSYMYYQNDTQDVMRHYNGATGAVVLQPIAGNVGIGITNPGYKLEVSGTCNVSGDTRVAGQFTINNNNPTVTFQDTDGMTGYWHCNANLMYLLRGGVNAAYGSWAQVNGQWPVYWDLSNNNANFGGSINMIGNGTRIQFNSTSTWSGDAGASFGKLEYHAERWYINAGSNSDRIVQFRRAGSDVSYVDNGGSYIGTGGTFSSLVQVNRLRPYSTTYGTSYSQAAIEVREYNFEGAGGYEMSRSPRIGFHWGGVVASSIAIETSGRIIITNNPGNAYERFASGTYYNSGSIGIRMDPSYALDCAGSQAYLMQSAQSGYGWNRFTGYPNETTRSQVVLQSLYSDLIVCSSEYNGTHGPTISFTTNSPSNNDYRKFVINVGNWGGYGTGGYGDRMSFGWKDGAYPNPHTMVTPDDSVMCLWGRNKAVGINNVGSPGYNLHVNGNGYFSTQCYVGDWFRVYGSGGLYWESHGGGWQMTDSTWIRAYNSKAIYCENTIACTGDIIAYYSDMRLKKNIVPIDDALEKLMGLSTFTYEANEVAESLGYKPHERNLGFSAQEVKKILPEVIRRAPCDIGETNDVTGVTASKTGEDYMTLLYDRMLPFVVKALQEESTARRELQTRVEALEKLLVKE